MSGAGVEVLLRALKLPGFGLRDRPSDPPRGDPGNVRQEPARRGGGESPTDPPGGDPGVRASFPQAVPVSPGPPSPRPAASVHISKCRQRTEVVDVGHRSAPLARWHRALRKAEMLALGQRFDLHVAPIPLRALLARDPPSRVARERGRNHQNGASTPSIAFVGLGFLRGHRRDRRGRDRRNK